jgi:SsrA-binding protein
MITSMAVLIENKKARFDYEILEEFESGIELEGFEVMALRSRQGSLEGAYVTIRGGEAYIINMFIPPYQPSNTPNDYEPRRNRKLLLTKKELSELAGKESQKGLTIVPLSVYNKKRWIKVSVAVVRGKKKFDKRESIKRRDTERDIAREFSDR